MSVNPTKKKKPAVEEVSLPPAGPSRESELDRREDALAEQAETLTNEGNLGAIDPAKLEPIPEILQDIDGLEITHPSPEHAYCWVRAAEAGRHVFTKTRQGWEVVQGEMAECPERKETDSLRRLGDCILMRITKGRKAILDAQAAERVIARDRGPEASFLEQAERHGLTVIDWKGTDEQTRDKMLSEMQTRSATVLS